MTIKKKKKHKMKSKGRFPTVQESSCFMWSVIWNSETPMSCNDCRKKLEKNNLVISSDFLVDFYSLLHSNFGKVLKQRQRQTQ